VPEVALSETKKYRRFTVQQKAELGLASFRDDRSIAEICRERDMSMRCCAAGAVRWARRA
jgi:hypothetical protein